VAVDWKVIILIEGKLVNSFFKNKASTLLLIPQYAYIKPQLSHEEIMTNLFVEIKCRLNT